MFDSPMSDMFKVSNRNSESGSISPCSSYMTAVLIAKYRDTIKLKTVNLLNGFRSVDLEPDISHIRR